MRARRRIGSPDRRARISSGRSVVEPSTRARRRGRAARTRTQAVSLGDLADPQAIDEACRTSRVNDRRPPGLPAERASPRRSSHGRPRGAKKRRTCCSRARANPQPSPGDESDQGLERFRKRPDCPQASIVTRLPAPTGATLRQGESDRSSGPRRFRRFSPPSLSETVRCTTCDPLANKLAHGTKTPCKLAFSKRS
jgi:hypothetical protein